MFPNTKYGWWGLLLKMIKQHYIQLMMPYLHHCFMRQLQYTSETRLSATSLNPFRSSQIQSLASVTEMQSFYGTEQQAIQHPVNLHWNCLLYFCYQLTYIFFYKNYDMLTMNHSDSYRKEGFFLMMHSTHFLLFMVIWCR